MTDMKMTCKHNKKSLYPMLLQLSNLSAVGKNLFADPAKEMTFTRLKRGMGSSPRMMVTTRDVSPSAKAVASNCGYNGSTQRLREEECEEERYSVCVCVCICV